MNEQRTNWLVFLALSFFWGSSYLFIKIGFDDLLPRIDPPALLTQPPEQAIDEMLARVFPEGTDQLEDDLAVILLTLSAADSASASKRVRVA